jgi:hypothetical protein
VDPKLVHRVSPELEHLLGVALSKNLSLRPYVNEMRYHCWVTEEPLEDYLEKGIVYQADGFVLLLPLELDQLLCRQEFPRPGTSGGTPEYLRKASSFYDETPADATCGFPLPPLSDLSPTPPRYPQTTLPSHRS